jgi:membrane protease YdiL (CAAX protease family)
MENFLLNISEWAGAVAVAMIAGVSPKFHRTKLVFKYPRREGIVALGVFGFAMLVALILMTLPKFSILGLSIDVSYRLFLAAGGLVPVVVALIRRKQPVRSAGWGRDKLNPSIQLGLALAFMSIFLRGKFSAVVNGLNATSLSLLGFSLVVALLEETTFRGYIQQRLAAWWGSNPGWLAAAGLYLVWQLPRLLGSAPEQLWLNLGIALAQSLVAGFIMQRSSHVLAPALFRAVSDWLFFF